MKHVVKQRNIIANFQEDQSRGQQAQKEKEEDTNTK